MRWFVYVLVDPTTLEIRYVGWTINPKKPEVLLTRGETGERSLF